MTDPYYLPSVAHGGTYATSPIVSASTGGLNTSVGMFNPATLILSMGAPAIEDLISSLFGGGDDANKWHRPRLPTRPQGQVPVNSKSEAQIWEEMVNALPPGFVYDEQGWARSTDPTDDGYYVIPYGGPPFKVTPPLVPVPKPTAGAGGGGGSQAGGGGAQAGGGSGGITPDETPAGPTPLDKPPTNYTDDEWYDIISGWLVRFPNATDAEKAAAIADYNVPQNVVDQVLSDIENAQAPSTGSGSGTGGGTGAGVGNGAGSGTGGGTGSGNGGGTGGRQLSNTAALLAASPGRMVEVTPGELAEIKYLFDVGGESIFPPELEERLYVSPYRGYYAGGTVDPYRALIDLLERK